jgi:hypothetical protein
MDRDPIRRRQMPFKRGRAAAQAIAGSIIMKAMTQPEDRYIQIDAAKFYLARRGGWSERKDTSLEVTVGGLTMNVEEQLKH